MKKILFIAVLAALIGFDSVAKAQEPADQPLEELFQTEVVYPQEKGALQFTSAAIFSNVNRKFSNDVGVEYGLTRAWQIGLQWESFARKRNEDGSTSRGSGDLRLETKYSFMNMRGSHFHSAVGFELGLPAASIKRAISEGEVEYEPFVIVARDFPTLSRLQLFSQFGLTFTHPGRRSTALDNHPGKTIEWNSGMFVVYRRARLTSEVNWSKNATENSLYVTPGIIWKLPRDLEVGFGVPVGLNRDADKIRTIVKVVYEFGGARNQGNENLPTTPRL